MKKMWKVAAGLMVMVLVLGSPKGVFAEAEQTPEQ